jgi:mono/diheme cytochrome c family protein
MMASRRPLYLLICGVVVAAGSVAAQSTPRPGYDIDYLGAPLADPVMQYSKETYVLFGCAYCHGLDLTPRGEATDLRRSVLVGGDQNANLIGPLLRAGIPQTAKLSPMPQFSDLSDQQIAAIARWIHYARQRARYKELTESAAEPGDASAGRAYFDRTCASCHSTDRDLAGIGKKHDASALRAQILEPRSLINQPSYRVDRLRDTRTNTGREQHQTLLENYSADEVTNLVAHLQSVR